MSNMVIGLENELSAGVSSSHTQAEKKQLVSGIVNGVKEIITAVPCQEAGVPLPGFMLSNGSRIYQDVGDYLESATPEVRTPIEAVVYQRANELLLLKAVSTAAPRLHINPAHVKLVRAVTDHAGHYRGMHINVSARNYDAAALVEHLTPFLITRFYACAGSFGSSGFVMSQKNSAIKTVASKDTRENRGILNLKNEPLATSNYKRIHLTFGDATMSELSTFLSVGCTALAVKMLDDGVCVGPSYTLLDPVGALKQLDVDFNWTTVLRLASGLTASPIQIQEHYLKAAEVYSEHNSELWIKEVVKRWRWAINTLCAQGPKGLSRTLDPYIKLKLYSKYLEQDSMTLKEFSQWCASVAMVKHYFNGRPKRDIRNYLKERMPAVSFYFLEDNISRNKLNWANLPRAIALYNKMIALDIMFHDINSEHGIYFRLRDTGMVDSQLVDSFRLHEAMCQPPRDTRAYARGNAIREAASERGTVANWTEVKNANRRANLFDPLVATHTWQELKRVGPKR